MKQNYHTSSEQQSVELRYDMANILSLLQLRLYLVKQHYVLDDEEIKVFDCCLARLLALLSHWNRLGTNEITE